MNQLLKTLTIALLFTANSVSAQNSMFDLGLEGGPNLSTILIKSPYSDIDTKPVILGSGGFIFQYNYKNFLSLKTGISYQRKGYQSNGTLITDQNGWAIGSSQLDYLTLPVLVKTSFGKKVKFFVNVGPYLGFLLKKKDNGLSGGSHTYTNDLYVTRFKRLDFGIAGGIGIAIPIRTFWEITVEARNYSGFLDLTRNDYKKWRTNTTDLRVGVAYKLGFYKDEK